MYNFAIENKACIESVLDFVQDLLFLLEVAYLSVHAFVRGDIYIENTSCHVFIHNKTPKDSYFVV